MVLRGSLKSAGLVHAIVEQFADGQWHTLDAVVAACDHRIPPEIALRRAREHGATRGTLAERVESGRRSTIAQALRKLGAEPGGPTPRTRWSRFRLAAGALGSGYGVPIGAAHHEAKVTEADVRAIRLRYALGQVTMRELAEEYGMGVSGIQRIIRRVSWRHVP